MIMITKEYLPSPYPGRSQQEPLSSPMAIPVRVFYWYMLPIHSNVLDPCRFNPKRQQAAQFSNKVPPQFERYRVYLYTAESSSLLRPVISAEPDASGSGLSRYGSW